MRVLESKFCDWSPGLYSERWQRVLGARVWRFINYWSQWGYHLGIGLISTPARREELDSNLDLHFPSFVSANWDSHLPHSMSKLHWSWLREDHVQCPDQVSSTEDEDMWIHIQGQGPRKVMQVWLTKYVKTIPCTLVFHSTNLYLVLPRGQKLCSGVGLQWWKWQGPPLRGSQSSILIVNGVSTSYSEQPRSLLMMKGLTKIFFCLAWNSNPICFFSSGETWTENI